MKKGKTISVLKKIVEASPVGLPYVGAIYAQLKADEGSETLERVLNDILSSTNDLVRDTKLSKNEITTISINIQRLINESSNKKKLTVVVPVGGDGGSLFPLTQVMPKCLVTIGHKSMLQHILDSFASCRELFTKVIILTGKYSAAIEENVRQGRYGSFVECKNLSESKSVPHALLMISDELKKGPFLLHYNDILIEGINWKHIHSRYFDNPIRRDQIGMLLCSKYYPLGIGVITEGEAEILKSFEEKPDQLLGGTMANLAVAIFEPEFLDYIEEDHSGIFESSVKEALDAKRTISLYKVNKWHHIQDLKALYDFLHGDDVKYFNNAN